MFAPRPSFPSCLLTMTLVLSACASRSDSDTKAPERAASAQDSSAVIHARLTLLSHDGKPLDYTWVEITQDGHRDPLADVKVRDGRPIEVELPGPGVYFAQTVGLNHEHEWWPFRVEAGGSVAFEARLGTYGRAELNGPLRLRARWIGADGRPTEAEVHEAQGSGDVWSLELKPPKDARTFQYQLTEVFEGGPPAISPSRDELVCDEIDCWAQVDTTPLDGKLTIDLGELPPSNLAPRWTVQGAERVPTSVLRAWSEVYTDPVYAGMATLGAFAPQDDGSPNAAPERAALLGELRGHLEQMRADIASTSDPDMRVLRSLEYLGVAGQLFEPLELGPEPVLWALSQVAADDWRWSVFPFLESVVLRTWDIPEGRAFFEEMLQNSPVASVRGALLHVQILKADEAGDRELAQRAFAQLERDHPYSWSYQYARETHDPSRPLQLGRKMPAWSFAHLDAEQGELSASELAGRTYLLDVWSTWCGPCVGEMKHLHEAYAQINGIGYDQLQKLPGTTAPKVEFVALSFDEDIEAVHRFRQDQWSMPWINLSLTDDDEQRALFDAWVFWGIPKLVLVGPDGTILATEKELRGEKLLETLERVLAGD